MRSITVHALLAGLIGAGLLVFVSLVVVAESPQASSGSGQPAAESAKERVSAAAIRAWEQVVLARGAIGDGLQQRAESALARAKAAVDEARRVRPSTRLRDQIGEVAQQLDRASPQDAIPDLSGIETVLAELDEMVSVKRAREHLDAVKSQLVRGDKAAAREGLRRLGESHAHPEIDLPLASAERQVEQALALVTQGRLQEAVAPLEQAEASIAYVALGPDVALERARSALWLARKRYGEGQRAAAMDALTQARAWLEQVSTDGDTKGVEQVRRLKGKIDRLTETITPAELDPETTLAGFWARTVALIEREAETLYHSWRTQQDENLLYRKLIDAKVHLFYAEHELFYSNEAEDAELELDEAVRYLHAAAELASEDQKLKIEAVEKEVVSLKQEVREPGYAARASYDQARADLRSLIEKP